MNRNQLARIAALERRHRPDLSEPQPMSLEEFIQIQLELEDYISDRPMTDDERREIEAHARRAYPLRGLPVLEQIRRLMADEETA